MKYFEIVAHRGLPLEAPENSIDSFNLATKLGADAIEFDVRLTADQIPIIYHYFYLQEVTNFSRPIFNFTYEELKKVKFNNKFMKRNFRYKIPTLEIVLKSFGDKIGLEIEIKGPEPESVEIIAKMINKYKNQCKNLEVTSYEPYLLRKFKKYCPDIKTDLLIPLSENWMKSDVIIYLAIQRARIAKTNTIHLHPSQLSPQIMNKIRKKGYKVHAWDVSDESVLIKVLGLNIDRICTDNCRFLIDYRQKIFT
ncbi:MAG: glycerophosphodiester phosphodiesterase [Candidatus Lokiarchaeota archaeon]|jgi:glycerophosphoryl diester phosphodiesterase